LKEFEKNLKKLKKVLTNSNEYAIIIIESEREVVKMLTRKELHDALEQGKEVVMFKYKQFGCWSAPKKVSKEVALHKSQVYVFNSYGDCYCPYGFQLA